MNTERKIVIACPCSAENRDQVVSCAIGLKEQEIFIERASWFKPRTKPGFEGAGTAAAPWSAEVTNMGIVIATEVLLPEHVTQVIEGVEKNGGNPSLVALWLGSRNQNHMIQRDIAKRTSCEAPASVCLLIKNQPWSDEKHWLGIVDHVVNAGIDPDRIILVHRGFSPNANLNEENFRNTPDFKMAMQVKDKAHLPILLDPSHIGGSVENVFTIVKRAKDYDFDGLMVEVHTKPAIALTDSKQQLTLEQLRDLLIIYNTGE